MYGRFGSAAANSNKRSGSAARTASVGRPPSTNTRTYLNPTTSSTSHAKGGLAKVNTSSAALNSIGNGLHNKPPTPTSSNQQRSAVEGLDNENPNSANNNNNNADRNGGGNSNDALNNANVSQQRPGSSHHLNNSNINSVARTVYRPSAILVDKITHGQHPQLLPIDPHPLPNANSPTRSVADRSGIYVSNYSPGRPSSGMGGGGNVLGGDGQFRGNFRPSSTAYGNMDAFNNTNASNMSYQSNATSILPASVGAKDLLRYKETLKTHSPSAMAVEASRQQLLEDQERERIAKLEHREQWRRSVEAQLRAKEERRQEEKARGLKERTVIEDRYQEERAAALAKKKQMAAEIQQQKYDDEVRAQIKAQEAVERAREERFQMDETVRQMQKEKLDSRVNKVRTQQEILSQATSTQRARQEERVMTEAERKHFEKMQADAAKEAEVRENLQIRQLQKQRQREVLEQSRTLSAIKQMNDSRAQMEYEAALEKQKRQVEDRDAKEKREQLEAKARLAQLLKHQMQDRQEARTAERQRTIQQQREAADNERRAAEQEKELERQRKAAQKHQLQQELEVQMNNNMNKTLVDLIQH